REMPMKELVLVGKALDSLAHPRRHVLRIVLDAAEYTFGDRIGECPVLPPNEGGAPGVREEMAVEVTARADQLGVALLFSAHRRGPVAFHLQDVHGCGEIAESVAWLLLIEQVALAAMVVLIPLLRDPANGLIVSLYGLECLIGDALRN